MNLFEELEESFKALFSQRIPPNPDEEDETFPQGPEVSSSTDKPVKEK